MKERIAYQNLPKGLYNAMMSPQNYVDQCGIDLGLLELIRMRVSQINSCAYCMDMHFKEGIEAGESALRLFSVSAWRETPYYSPQEEAVLEFTEKLTRMAEEEHSHDIHEKLDQYFSKEEIANLTLAIIQINSWNRLVRSFGFIPGQYKVQSKTNV
ncbi:carboxymuconolactone decarboxylase family protein [Echinicola sp. CAU 1574]|uniref:Carboxymuconolactone decarboxylase family protein n=1 Tax=Echinicola arenosa TaxID=2774144 RepID=A0ABR9AEI0_9BACT|nr:carboxymuconolactone decarboxylase family protein [Echinicola arenosa]MBD8487152.1 carboxymuconolactone decarboxylase family protein [Echinicola arenosa]